MAAKKKTSNKSPLVGTVTKPITLDQTTKLDIDTNKKIVDNIIEASIGGNLNTAELEQFTAISNSRDQVYQLIDTMMKDSVVSSIVRTYAEDACEVADNGHIIWCESNDPNISKFVNYLLNIMNVDKNIFSWVDTLIKYGDVYLRLYRESDYKDPLFKKDSIDNSFSAKTQLNEAFNQTFEEPTSKETASLNEVLYLNVHSASDPYSYYIEMVPDPGSMFELTKFGKTYGYIETPNVDQSMSYLSNYLGVSTASGVYNYRMKTNDVNIYQADDFVHAYLADDTERFPEKVDIFLTEEDYKNGKNPQAYQVKRGKSLLYDSYKIWREKSLLENAVLLNRITRSSVVRTIQVEVGDMSKTQVQKTLTRIKSLMEQKSSIDAGSSYSEYTNPGPVENNIYLATHNGQGAVTIGTMGGDVDIKNIADLDYWTNKFYSSYGIPKQYFGWTDDAAGFNGGTSLSILSSIYGKGVIRIQNAIIQAITDAVNLILINKGCKAYLNNFVLKMKAPATQEEKDYRESLSNRVNTISNIQSLFSEVEDKSNKLNILKTLVSTLNYGDELTSILDKEIAIADKQKQEAEEAKAKEAEEAAKATAAEEKADASDEASDMDLDLGMADVATNEEIESHGKENETLLESQDLIDTDDLPLPEDLAPNKDFTKNE